MSVRRGSAAAESAQDRSAPDRSTLDKARRGELAAFLRNRRERITPDEVGIAPGPRRRTPGLRREELAQLAGVGVTWYTWLEQGRPINVSVTILDAVADVLRLGSAERWHLYRLAEVPGIPTLPVQQSLPIEVLGVIDALDPAPACVYNGKYDLIACNESYAALFPGLVDASGIERNALWQMYGCGVGNSPVTDPDVCESMVATLRVNYASHLGEPDWVELIDALCAASPEFAQIWESHLVAGYPRPVTKAFECFGLGTVRVRATGFNVSDGSGLRMVAYVPESPADAALLTTLRARMHERIATSRVS